MNHSDLADLATRAQASADAGNMREARHLFDALCRADPDNSEAWLMAGVLHGETGSPEEALSCLGMAIRISPGYPEAHLATAHVHKALKSLDASYASVKCALEIDADYDEAWVFLGNLCCEMNRFEEAEQASREAIKRWPENIQPHISLGTALCSLGREAEAEPVVRHAMTLEGGGQPMISALLGRVLLGNGSYAEAEALIQTALPAAPDDITLLLNLAYARLRQDQHEAAEAVFRSVIERVPQRADAWNGLGEALQGQFKLKAAEQSYRQAMALDSENLSAACNLALLQEINGEFDEAAESLRAILAHHPGQLDAIGGLASVLEKRGDISEAIQTLEMALESPEKNVRVGLAFQKLCGKMNRRAEALQFLQDILARTGLSPEDRAATHFALGNLYDAEAEYDLAFDQYERANTAKAQTYDPDGYTAYINQLLDAFSSSAFSSLPVSSTPRSERMVFIVGMPRSGTSLVERVLSSHSAVYAAGELRNLTELSGEVGLLAGADRLFPSGVENLAQTDVDRLSEKYLNVVADMAPAEARVTDKLPHNFQYIGLIRALFPEARIIHCTRDARDTCLSCYFQNFFGHHPYTSNLEYLGRHYLDYQRLMAHWHSLNIPVLDVPYEQMVEDPELWIRRLVEYCDLAWEEQCLRFYESNQFTRTASYDQVRQPIYKRAIGRWQHYESHLSPLLAVLAKQGQNASK